MMIAVILLPICVALGPTMILRFWLRWEPNAVLLAVSLVAAIFTLQYGLKRVSSLPRKEDPHAHAVRTIVINVDDPAARPALRVWSNGTTVLEGVPWEGSGIKEDTLPEELSIYLHVEVKREGPSAYRIMSSGNDVLKKTIRFVQKWQ